MDFYSEIRQFLDTGIRQYDEAVEFLSDYVEFTQSLTPTFPPLKWGDGGSGSQGTDYKQLKNA